jgi:arylsulfatase A-like enzyme
LLDVLDASALANNTVIVLWSDHGWQLGEKEHWGKWTGWERSAKVPLIIVPPKQRAAEFANNARCDQPVGLIDLYPTLIDLCGIKSPAKLSGQSLAPLLRSPQKTTGRALVTMFGKNNVSLRTERWRYIRYEDGAEELYDLIKDPNEWDNLERNPEYTAKRKELRELAKAYLVK